MEGEGETEAVEVGVDRTGISGLRGENARETAWQERVKSKNTTRIVEKRRMRAIIMFVKQRGEKMRKRYDFARPFGGFMVKIKQP